MMFAAASPTLRPTLHYFCSRTTLSCITPLFTRFHYSYHGPGHYHSRNSNNIRTNFEERAFTVGIGGPVGSGKTRLVLQLCKKLLNNSSSLNIGVVTNDIFTQEDAEFLIEQNVLPRERVVAVETGACPHAAIREDVSMNLSACEKLTLSQNCNLIFCESGGDNLAANFSSELADYTIYVIDVAGGDDVPRKGGPGITQSDLLVINKIDLSKAVGVDLDRMKRDSKTMRGDEGPTLFCAVKHNDGVDDIVSHVLDAFQQATGESV